MKIVTSGSAYLDIDAYACCIAYAELLNLLGEEAYPASSAKPNGSVPQSLRDISEGLKKYAPSDNDQFVLVDVSKETFFDPIVKNGEVVEVIDHRPGFEEYWREKLGDRADIEMVGAACTQVFERWQKAGKIDLMTKGIAQLLAAGILDNTLNFNAEITTQRDHDAYYKLRQIGELPDDFAEQYFVECQGWKDDNFYESVDCDIKEMDEIPKLPRWIGQFIVWDAKHYASDKKSQIIEILQARGSEWAFNLICLSEGRSYFISSSEIGQHKLTDLLGINFENDVAVADRLWLRKELMKLALDNS